MMTTIQISKETKELIGTFGNKEDTYDTIVRKMYELATREQIKELLLSGRKTVTIDEARAIIREKWPK